MALVDEILRLRDIHVSSLDASHDYYSHTRDVWRFLQRIVRQGTQFTFRNQVTGNKASETELATLAQNYVTDNLASATFQHFVSLFERFVFDLVAVWLREYPDSLQEKEFKFKTVLEATDKNEIVASVVQKELLGIEYQGVVEWFRYLENIAKLGCPNQDQIARLSEIKASRDILVHNNGIANKRYVEKTKGYARFADGDRLELPEQYHRESWELIKQVVNDVAEAAILKMKK